MNPGTQPNPVQTPPEVTHQPVSSLSSHQPYTPQFATNPIPQTFSQKRSFGWVIWLFVCLLLVAALGAATYAYKTTNDTLATRTTELAKANQTSRSLQATVDVQKEASSFIAQYNTSALSRSSCNGKPLAMFDVHITSGFVAYHYLCANTATPILIGAFAKHKDGTTDFTYSSSTNTPNNLPSYIYDTDAAFFGAAFGAIRS